MFIRHQGVVLGLAGIPVTVSMHSIFRDYGVSAAGLLLYMLCLRAVIVRYLIWAAFIYASNLVLIFAFGRDEVAGRSKQRWKELLKAQMNGNEGPSFSYQDTIDRAVQLKMGAERLAFRWRSRRGRVRT